MAASAKELILPSTTCQTPVTVLAVSQEYRVGRGWTLHRYFAFQSHLNRYRALGKAPPEQLEYPT